MAENWHKRIKKSQKFLEHAKEHGRKVYARYKDTRDDSSALRQKANFFFSNVNTIKESLFNSLPKPDVSRIQRGDFEDNVSRVAADLVRRILAYEIECAPAFREAIELAILDRLVPGLGTVWISFHAEMPEGHDERQEANDPGEMDEGPMEPLPGSEQVQIEHVYWEDFLYEPCKKWSKCGWVARVLHLTKDEVQEAYGEEILQQLTSSVKDSDDVLVQKEILADTFCVYEVWDKRTKMVYHVAEGIEEPLKKLPDPYQLKGFFPCPRPLIANVDSTGFLPVTDYHVAQDQYNQLDVLYGRIQLIVEAIKVAGLYDSSNSNIPRMLQGAENQLIPVDQWAMHAERGGNQGQIDWFPVEVVAQVLQHLYAAFEATKAMLYEITGMSDIVRGASNQYETAKAQQIKAQFASVRLNGFQRDVATFVRDILRIMAELATQLYGDQKVMAIVGDLPQQDQQYLPQAAAVLRDDVLSKYKVNIQTNSLTEADWAMEKQERMEVVQVVGQMIGQVLQGAQQAPEIVPLGVHLIKFAIAGFRAGTELESYIDSQLDSMAQQAQQAKDNPQPPEPSPEEKKAQAEMQKMQMEMQMKQQEAQSKQQLEEQKMQLQIEQMKMEMQFKQQMAQIDLQIKQQELAMKGQEQTMNLQAKQQDHELNAAVKQQEAAMGLEQKQQAFEQQSEQKDASFAQQQKQAAQVAKTQPKPKGDA